MSRSATIAVLAAAMMLAHPAMAAVPEAAALGRVEAYLAAHNRHDVDATMAFYADDAVFLLNGGRAPVHGKAAIRDLERFDVVAGSNVDPRGLAAHRQGEDVVISFVAVVEHSRVFAAAGLETVTTQGSDRAFVVRPDGLFALVAQPEFAPACRQVMGAAIPQSVAWLTATRDPRAAILSPGGKFTLTVDTVPAMIAALQDWRAATGWSPDPALVAACAKGVRKAHAASLAP